MSTYFLKKHDTGKNVGPTVLRNADGTVIDLTGCSVKFIATVAVGTTAKINAAATINSPATSGSVQYSPVAGDVDTAATYLCEWEVTLPSAKTVTVPDPGYDTLQVDSDLG